MRRLVALASIGLLAFALSVVGSALTAANTVPVTRLVNHTRAIGANDLKPAACAGLTVTTLRTGSGSINGTSAAELILGSSGADTIGAAAGTDCVLGGGGTDSINGGGGNDVCIGGPDFDTFSSCESSTQ